MCLAWGTGGKAESYWSEGDALPVSKDVIFILHLRIFLRGWSQGCGFPGDHVWMWELNYKESWVQKNGYFWTVVLEKTLESPLDCKEIQVHPKGDQSWMFIGWTDAEAEAPILWPPGAKSQLWKRSWCWERLRAGEGSDRGWGGWMASLTQCTWVWANSGRWLRRGKPDVHKVSKSWTWLLTEQQQHRS